jgi:hypothetical protein
VWFDGSHGKNKKIAIEIAWNLAVERFFYGFLPW